MSELFQQYVNATHGGGEHELKMRTELNNNSNFHLGGGNKSEVSRRTRQSCRTEVKVVPESVEEFLYIYVRSCMFLCMRSDAAHERHLFTQVVENVSDLHVLIWTDS